MATPLADNLRRRARELSLTHNEVARRADLHERRFANYALGRREPDLQTLVRIARVLQTTPNALLGIEMEVDDPMLSRLSAAAAELEPADLQILVRQAEVMVEGRKRASDVTKQR